MGLVYDPRDSVRVKVALSGSLATAVSVLDDLGRACGRLTAAVQSGELSGQAYSAADAMFSRAIVPSIADAEAQVASLQRELERYEWEDAKVSRLGVLKEDELRVQLRATKSQRDATQRLIETNETAATALSALPGLADSLLMITRRLELVLGQLDKDVRDLEDRLQALHHFDAATRGLFQNGLGATTVAAMITASVSSKRPAGARSQEWTPSELMNLLWLLSPDDVQRMLSRDPELAQRFWDLPPPAETVATWWKGLTPAAREEWSQAAPSIIGNLPGLDADSRIHANMIQFQRDLRDPGIDPNSPRGIVLRDILKALKVDTHSGPLLDYERLAKTQMPARGLLSYNSTRQPPLAAIAIGDTRAEKSGKVTWAVPGMNSGLGQPGRLSGWSAVGVNVHRQQGELEPGVPHMVVAWIGYEPPTLDASVLQGDRARAGAIRLSRELDGQWAADRILAGNPEPFTAVVGHSYGTTLVTNALSASGAVNHHVQSVVLLASAGVERNIPHADALSVAGGPAHVYASQSSRDGVADDGRTFSGRSDPRDEKFGATVFSSEGDSAQGLKPTDGHDAIGYGSDNGIVFAPHATKGHGYLDPGTESIRNTAAASLGLDDRINGTAHSGRSR